MTETFDVVVVGAGPAGLMAGISAKTKTNKVCILEKNASAGVKLLISGKGRCNVTTTKEIKEIVEAFGSTGKFLHGALSRFSNQDLMNFFEDRGVGLKVERGQRVFPVSDRSESILSCLLRELRSVGTKIYFNNAARAIKRKDGLLVIRTTQGEFKPKKVIITTGGASYPNTGSTGDGYKIAKEFGHNIIDPIPALTPLLSNDKNITELSGLSLKNVEISFSSNEKVFAKEFGEMIFTHKGISGPIVLTCSRMVYEHLALDEKVMARIDFKPALNEKTLRARIVREITEEPKKEYKSLLTKLLPKSLVEYAVVETQIDSHQQGSTLSKIQIDELISFLKNFSFEIKGVESIKRAIVTHGGIDIKDINPKTMESKIVDGLYFAGEIICLDGPTGGFNLTKAFSTGFVAGRFASKNFL